MAILRDPKFLAIPVFFGTVVAEAFALRNDHRPPGPLRRTGTDLGAGAGELRLPKADPPRSGTPASKAGPGAVGADSEPSAGFIGYEFRDTATSLAMGVGNLVINTMLAGAFFKFDERVRARRIVDVGNGKFAFVVAMVGWDFLYYWDHRLSHEVRLFWANHVSHHSSQHYNLSTALRQPWSGFLTHWVFALLPLLGVRPAMNTTAGSLNLLYQYWVHTELIDRMPSWFEKVMNTPSHHRAHHGANPQYLDKNYAGIFIIWDRMFGTFEPEVEPVVYGLTKNIDTFNPLRVAYHEFIDIADDVRRSTSWRQRFHRVFGPPGQTPLRLTPAG